MITVEHLTKCYGDFKAVDDLNFTVDEGRVHGFLGPNGAGKSTTMNIMAGCLSPTEGTVTIGGFDILEQPDQAKKLIGYLPEQPPLYTNETPYEYLRFVAEAKGIRGSEIDEQIERIVEQTGIADVKNKIIGTLSKGYKQRVGIAQALLGNPKVIILDEPTVGLDPLQIIEIRNLIRKLGETHMVIFSSHILSEVQAICDDVIIISKGRMAAHDSTENLEHLMNRSCVIHLAAEGSCEDVIAILETIGSITEFHAEAGEDGSVYADLQLNTEETRKVCCELFRAFALKDIPVFEITSKKANLEEVFLELTEEDSHTDKSEEEQQAAEEETGEDTE